MNEEIFFTLIIVAMICGFVLVVLFGKRDKIRSFIPQSLADTFKSSLERKLDAHGKKVPGAKLYMGMHEICHIDSYLELKTVQDVAEFDEVTKNITVSKNNEKETFSILILKAKNRSPVLRWLGMKPSYYVINAEDKEGKKIYQYDNQKKRFIFPYYLDFVSYGEVWVNSDASRNYLHDFSVKRMLETTQMYIENQPDKIIHLEAETARRERIARTYMDLEKGKYEETKHTADTVIK